MQLKNLNQPPEEFATSSEYNLKESQPPVPNYLDRIGRQFGNLSISDKISRGYALALCVAIGGTTLGMLAGDRYYRITNNQINIDRESSLLNKLQVALLRTQTDRQRLVYGIEKPEIFENQYQQLQKNTDSLKSLLSEVQSHKTMEHVEGFQDFIKVYYPILSIYIQKLETVTDQLKKLQENNAKTSVKSKLLSDLAKNKIELKLDSATNELAEIIDRAEEQEGAARSALLKARALRAQIVFASMALSIVVAVMLANFTSRAIAKPLAAVTNIAERVTQESNFELQVPVTGTDEVGVLATSLNQLIMKVNNLLAELKTEQETKRFQNDKMVSLGRMLAGVAHEINNPINFIYANIDPARNYVEDILQLLETYETEIPSLPPAVLAHAEEIDLDFVKEDLMKIFQSMQVGAERAKALVLSLKDFSRLEDEAPTPVDLHACIDSSLLILNNRIKHGIEVVRNYGNIPKVEGYMGLLYQVFVNIINNAIDALEEKVKIEKTHSNEVNHQLPPESQEQKASSFLPKISITTEYLDDDSVVVRISDNGTGMPRESQEKMFQTFFTTKPRGVGTGLGLAIGREIVVKKHGGTINCWSEVGTGTEFTIALPIKH
jgi:two-component system NtrC family sensor kinase